ncbi:P-loop containing nucleoside triphosphate hydrolases superfamily protein [Artemisia annua]|uniref:P-loop containing nucleoside triphosphate hydrolases superfamily protein n=1 Tax=Artemisia annua TaxID=35608 RepID=A0A2U1N3L8_ARTAN|nr:P-loop containing nucleoside triphosphate hydrolases superfamily protein [Artemisia annua]
MSGHDPDRSPLDPRYFSGSVWLEYHIVVDSQKLNLEAMGLVRVTRNPVVLSTDRGGCSVEDFCNQIHISLVKEVKYVCRARMQSGLPGILTPMLEVKGTTLLRFHKKESEGRGRFKMHITGPDRIADRVKKAPLKN